MAADSFYRKTFNIEFNYPKRNPDFLLISDANWVGGFPWKVKLKCQYVGESPYLIPFLLSAKRSNNPWKCKVSVDFVLESPFSDVKSVMGSGYQEYSNNNASGGWGIQKFCEWSKLPAFIKNGRLTLQVTITVDKKAIGGEPHPEDEVDFDGSYECQDLSTSCESHATKHMRFSNEVEKTVLEDYKELYEQEKAEKELVHELLEAEIREKVKYQKLYNDEVEEKIRLKEECKQVLEKTQAAFVEVVTFRNKLL